MSHRKRQLFDKAFDKLLQNDLIEASESAWSNPTVLVENEGKEPRLCLDARKLNDVTEADSYPLPSIPEIIGHLGDAQYFTVLDLSKGYLQIKLSDVDKEKTAFGSHRGFFHFTRMCFGLRNAPASFQRFIDKTLGELKWKCCLPYLDDIVIFSRTFQEHLMHLRQVLAKLEAAQVTVNPQKVQICCPEIQLLGFVVRPGSCSPSPQKMAALRNFPSPTKVLELQQVLGMVNYYRNHVPDFANKAIPLYRLLKKKVRWDWSSECEESLRGLLRDLEANAELKLPDLNKKFIIQSDASAFAIAAVLMQDTEQGLKPVSFISRALTSAERNYTTMEREGLAAIYALRKFRMYIECTRFEIQTDNMSLSWIKGLKDPTGRLARWALELSAHDCVITHIPGKKNTVADTFSRIELKQDTGDDEVECAMAALQPLSQISAGLPVTRKTLIEEQKKDPSLAKWFAMCRGQLVPGIDSGTGTGPVNHQGGRYSVEDDGLLLAYFASEDETDEEAHGDWKIVIPKSLRAQVIDYFHSHLLAGHLAVRKTVKRLCQRVTWRGLSRDVRMFVKTCDTCQKTKATNQKPAGLMKSVESSRPFEKITFDTMGPYTMSNGVQYLLVICDHFTKWIEVFPLRKLSTVNIWQPLRQWFTRFGYPRQMICDNASIHRSKLHTKLCNELGIKTQYISSYHAQANLTERYIRSFKQMIVSFTSQHKDWAKYTPELAFALRTAENETTGYSPAFLTFGRELKFPIDWEWNRPEPPIHSHTDYANRMQATLRTALELAKSATKKAQAKQKKYYDRTRRNVEFEPGMLVLRKTHMLSNASKQITAGLNKKRHGPFIILEKLSPLNYRLGDRDSGKPIGITHISELKEYNERPKEWQPTQLGQKASRQSSDVIPAEPDDLPTRYHYKLRPRL